MQSIYMSYITDKVADLKQIKLDVCPISPIVGFFQGQIAVFDAPFFQLGEGLRLPPGLSGAVARENGGGRGHSAQPRGGQVQCASGGQEIPNCLDGINMNPHEH